MKEILAVVFLILFIFTFSAALNVSNEKLAVELAEKYSGLESANVTAHLMQYFKGEAQMPEQFNSQEASHMHDVKNVLKGLYFSMLILLTLATLLLYFSKPDKVLFIAGSISLLVVGLVSITPFESLFTLMHKCLFPRGGWLFPANSTIITYYPQAFFAHYAIRIAVTITILSLLVLIIGLFQKIYFEKGKSLKKH